MATDAQDCAEQLLTEPDEQLAYEEFYGTRVRITLDESDPHASVIGVLRAASSYGEAIIDTDSGRLRVWPALEVDACPPVSLRGDR